MEKMSDQIIERAMKAHFLTMRRRRKEVDSGQRSNILQNERRRHRKADKLRRRLDALYKTTSWPEAEKAEFRKGMKISCMSPEHSEEEVIERDDESESDDDALGTKKILKTRPLSWRSERFQSVLESLDRKYTRRISEKARSMFKERIMGERMVCLPPSDIPDWMIKN
ncbi:uncharacterized protein LOC114542452 [Dendronephthya gigantea]|nr:uncharacterized protein LOC114542452 [Dendronephthya gigantea]